MESSEQVNIVEFDRAKTNRLALALRRARQLRLGTFEMDGDLYDYNYARHLLRFLRHNLHPIKEKRNGNSKGGERLRG